MPRPKKFHKLSHKDHRQINLFVSQGKYQRAAVILKRAKPFIELLAELRKMSAEQARAAGEVQNWQAVVRHLEAYVELTKQYRSACLEESNQEPPGLATKDQSLLDRARSMI